MAASPLSTADWSGLIEGGGSAHSLGVQAAARSGVFMGANGLPAVAGIGTIVPSVAQVALLFQSSVRGASLARVGSLASLRLRKSDVAFKTLPWKMCCPSAVCVLSPSLVPSLD